MRPNFKARETNMNIIIAGCGNVGGTLAEQLSQEEHKITVIDTNAKIVEEISDSFDVYGVVGTGSSINVLEEANIDDCDLFIAVTGNDEMNLLACLIAKSRGVKNLIARVGNPEYGREIGLIKSTLGLTMVINPHAASAREMAALLNLPLALNVDIFPKSRAEIISYKLTEQSPLNDMTMKEFGEKFHSEILVPVVERNDEVLIPGGDFKMEEGDIISVLASIDVAHEFFRSLGFSVSGASNAMLIGGGRTSVYLARILMSMGVEVKIIEQDPARCEKLSDILDGATIIQGDATDKNLLVEEGIEDVDAFISNTSFDEENVMLALYAKEVSDCKVITRIHRTAFDKIIDSLDIGSVVYPKYIIAERILRFVRSQMQNDSGILSLYQLNDNRVEAIEFEVPEDARFIDKPLSEIKVKKGVIIGCVTHEHKSAIATGSTFIHAGDKIVVLTTEKGLHDVHDIAK